MRLSDAFLLVSCCLRDWLTAYLAGCVVGQNYTSRDAGNAQAHYDSVAAAPWRQRRNALERHRLNPVVPWFLGLSSEAKKVLLMDGYQLHTPDVLHSFGRVMRDLALGFVDLCLACWQQNQRVVYSSRIAEQYRFRPHGRPALRTFPAVRAPR